jgi:predicted O-methyltransferase YrrM
MKQIIEKIYETRSVVGRSGQVHPLQSEIDREEGEFLFSLIRDDPGIRRTLEVGCAYGLSSLYICAATRDRAGASHTIIDPYQNTEWDGGGVANLERAGIDFFKLLEIKSEFALPQLLEHNEGQMDFIFLDGWHTFDHTLLDCFYATRLLRVGGVLALDDLSYPSIRRVVDFLKNYPCYGELGSVRCKKPKSWKRMAARALSFPVSRRTWAKILAPTLYRRIFEDYNPRMIALRKTREDTRSWDWHIDLF